MNIVIIDAERPVRVTAAEEQAITKQYFGELYEAQTRGGDLPVVRCPECRHYTMVNDASACTACGYLLGPETQWRDVCQNPMSNSERRANTHECPPFYND